MPANTNPIFTLTPRIGWGATALSAANTAKDGTGSVLGCFTAGANGSYIKKICFRPSGTAIQTVVRVFINNGSTNATAANNILFRELTLGPVTLSETAAQTDYELSINDGINASYVINCVLGTAVAAGYYIDVVGGDF